MPKVKLPKIIVAGLIEKKEEFFLLKEKMADGREMWLIPGGKVEFGESLEQALLREIKEETGFDVKLKRFISHKEAIFVNHNYHTIIFFYYLDYLGGDIKLDKKGIEGQFFKREGIKNLSLVDSAEWLFKNFF